MWFNAPVDPDLFAESGFSKKSNLDPVKMDWIQNRAKWFGIICALEGNGIYFINLLMKKESFHWTTFTFVKKRIKTRLFNSVSDPGFFTDPDTDFKIRIRLNSLLTFRLKEKKITIL